MIKNVKYSFQKKEKKTRKNREKIVKKKMNVEHTHNDKNVQDSF